MSAPRIAYHGSNTRVTAFNVDTGRNDHPDGLGAWFSEDRQTAEDFATDRARTRGGAPVVAEVAIVFANPLVVQTFDALRPLVRQHRTARRARAALQAQGYDGIVIDRSYPGLPDLAKDYIVFTPDSVRPLRTFAPGEPDPAVPPPGPTR